MAFAVSALLLLPGSATSRGRIPRVEASLKNISPICLIATCDGQRPALRHQNCVNGEVRPVKLKLIGVDPNANFRWNVDYDRYRTDRLPRKSSMSDELLNFDVQFQFLAPRKG
jgi:hypothetical protein